MDNTITISQELSESSLIAIRQMVKQEVSAISVQQVVYDEPLDIKQAARLLHLTDDTIRSYVRKRIIPFHRKSKLLYFFKSDLIDWVRADAVKPKVRYKA